MKEKFAALILGTLLMTALWLGAAQPAQALTTAAYGPQLSWIDSQQSLYNILAGLFGTQPSDTNTTSGSDNSNSGSTTSSGSTSGSTTNSGSTTGGSSTTTNGSDTANTGSTGSTTALTTAEKNYQKYLPNYQSHEVPIVDSYRQNYDGSLAQALVGRAIWYMEYGYMVYGHHKYWDTGYIDCSNFVSLVYKDFGYTVTSTARKYTTVGTKVEGVYSKKLSTGKWTLVGVDKLRPGDVFTFWNTDSNGNKYISHVALYMGVVNGKPCIINTAKEHPTAIGIINGFSYWYGEQLYEVRRVLPDSAYTSHNSSVKLSSPVIPAVYQLKPQNPIIMPKDLAVGF